MPLAVEEFSRRVADCGLMSAAEMAAFQAGIPPDRALKDAQDLARELVRQKRLTEFQAVSVYKGQTDMLVIGEYVVLDKIGTGGMGRVYKAEHRRMARRVAIKLLAEGAMSSPETIQRFEQEVRTSARLDHPNVVAAHDAGEHHGLHYLVMQYVDGRDLKSLVRERGRMPLEQAVSYIYQAACGLEHAHAEGVTHRDIKPGNLMVDKRGVSRYSIWGWPAWRRTYRAKARRLAGGLRFLIRRSGRPITCLRSRRKIHGWPTRDRTFTHWGARSSIF
jgi:serine/threonine protein kinase